MTRSSWIATTSAAHWCGSPTRSSRRTRARMASPWSASTHAVRAGREAARAGRRADRMKVPSGDLDISFYRDDVNVREPGAEPVVHASHLDFDLDGRTVVLVDDVLFTGRTVRAAIQALFDYGRPERCSSPCSWIAATASSRFAPTTSARTCRPPARSGSTCGWRSLTRSTRSRSPPGWRRGDEAPAGNRRPGALRHRADHRPRGGIRRGGAARHQEGADPRGRTVINLFYESSTRTSSSFELAAKRLSADVVTVKATAPDRQGESLKTPTQGGERRGEERGGGEGRV